MHRRPLVIYLFAGLLLMSVFAVMSWTISDKAGKDAGRAAAKAVQEKTKKDAKRLRESQLAGCERGKLDREDNARAFASMAVYYNGVTKAVSVKSDVKRIARKVQQQLEKSARHLASRILICVPLIDSGQRLSDTEALSRLPRMR